MYLCFINRILIRKKDYSIQELFCVDDTASKPRSIRNSASSSGRIQLFGHGLEQRTSLSVQN